jgi:alcohol dehydrogenase
MRAAVYSAFGGSITVKDLPKPEAPPGGVLIEVKATGVCRSDWHGWKGHDSDIVDHGLPFVPGHELSGVVAKLGEGVSGFAVGDRVAVPFILSCGGCRECKRGRATICEDQEQPGFTRFGSFAEFVALPRADRNLAHLPAEVSFEAAYISTSLPISPYLYLYLPISPRGGELRGGRSARLPRHDRLPRRGAAG